jgi:hypothetical protein
VGSSVAGAVRSTTLAGVDEDAGNSAGEPGRGIVGRAPFATPGDGAGAALACPVEAIGWPEAVGVTLGGMATME